MNVHIKILTTCSKMYMKKRVGKEIVPSKNEEMKKTDRQIKTYNKIKI